jgi:NAD(P)H-flavin reductase
MLPKDPERELVLVATGVGIAPNYALARHVLDAGFVPRVRIFWGLRLVEDICLLDELEGLAAKYPNFAYYISLSRPPEDWAELRGRVTHSMPPMLDVLGGTRFHLFGNGTMIAELAVALSDMGVLDEHIYKEPYFNNARHQPDPSAVDAIRARFTASDLFSPYAEQQRLFHLERPLGRLDPPPG